MNKEYKITLVQEEAREKIKEGVNWVADILGLTLGPAGKNALIERRGFGEAGRTPAILNDGVSIATRLIHKDEMVDPAVQVMIDGCKKTNEMVGDATTTTALLTQAIFKECCDRLSNEAGLLEKKLTPNILREEIKEAEKKVIELLEKSAKPIKTKEDFEKIAFVSYNNREMAEKIADISEKVGKDGIISTEEGWGYETKISVVKGMKRQIHYIKQLGHIVSTNARKEAVMDKPYILITNMEINNEKFLVDFCDMLIKGHGIRELVLVCGNPAGFHKSVFNFIVRNRIEKIFHLLPIEAMSLKEEELEDIAIFTGGRFFDTTNGFTGDVMPQVHELGRCRKVIADRDNVMFIDGNGKKEDVKKRIEKLKIERDDSEKAEEMKQRITKRIASLAGGVGLIEVASKTDAEKEFVYRKVEDAVNAVKAAREEGVVKGAGLALKEIAEKLPENILTEALKAINKKIISNGYDQKGITDDIIDPVKVLKVAVENACSLASTLITGEIVVAWKRDEGLDKQIAKAVKTAMNDGGYLKEKTYAR